MDAFDPAARAEFTRRFEHFDGYRSEARQDDLFTVFKSGMQYASTREPTDDEVEAAAEAAFLSTGPSVANGMTDDWANADEYQRDRWRTRARAALAAARNARMGS